MTFRHHPEYTAPDELRCDALVRGRKGWPDWAQQDHRCPPKATQSRACKSVCWQHANLPELEYVNHD